MKLQLMNGHYSSNEMVELVRNIIQVKINFHEQKISKSDSEEDIKQRENKIKILQEKLEEIRQNLKDKTSISLDGHLNFGL
jgi:hypothetical protein